MNRRYFLTIIVVSLLFSGTVIAQSSLGFRALIAMPKGNNQVFLSWRLFEGEAATGFYVYRSTESGVYNEPLNDGNPIYQSTCYLDENAPSGVCYYIVRPFDGEVVGDASNEIWIDTNDSRTEHSKYILSFSGDENKREATQIEPRMATGDFNGDGWFDLVFRWRDNSDYEESSVFFDINEFNPTTNEYEHKITLNSGVMGIIDDEPGFTTELAQYAHPCIVWDFVDTSGNSIPDGKDEIVYLYCHGEGNFEIIMAGYDNQGQFGPIDWAVIVPHQYKQVDRYKLIVAYRYIEDELKPCIILIRGIKDKHYKVARKYVELIAYDPSDLGTPLCGLLGPNNDTLGDQFGSHMVDVADIDYDFATGISGDNYADEILFSSNMLDIEGNNVMLKWTLNGEHLDKCLIGDVDPDNPGFEVFFGYDDPPSPEGEINSPAYLCDADDGTILWNNYELFKDVDKTWFANVTDDPGLECAAWGIGEPDDKFRIYKYNGEILKSGIVDSENKYIEDGGYIGKHRYHKPIRWTGGIFDNLIRYGQSFVHSYENADEAIWQSHIGTAPMITADIIGDFREEIIAVDNSGYWVYVYTNTEIVDERRTSYVFDRKYRQDLARVCVGYCWHNPCYPAGYGFNTTVGQGQISGTVTDGEGNPLNGIKVSLTTTPIETYTDSTGYYEFNNRLARSYLVTPSDDCFTFAPDSQIVVLNTDEDIITGVDFTATFLGADTVYQAEDPNNTLDSESVIENDPPGSDGGFVNLKNSDESFVQWNEVTVDTTKVWAVSFRYAYTDTAHRPMEISVNGDIVVSSLDFEDTGSFSTWDWNDVNLMLLAGNNTIKARSLHPTNGGPNLDKIFLGRPDAEVEPPLSPEFSDNFNDEDAEGWTAKHAERWNVVALGDSFSYAIIDSEYQSPASGILGEYSLIDSSYYDDFILTCNARTLEDISQNPSADYCAVFNYQDSSNYYYMMFNRRADNVKLHKVTNYVRTDLTANSNIVIPDTNFYSFEVSKIDRKISVKFDGDDVFQDITDTSGSPFGPGQIGLGSFNDMAAFDDVVISLPDSVPSDPPPDPPPAPETVILQPSPEELKDNSLYLKSNNTNSKNENDGDINQFLVGIKDEGSFHRLRRGIIQFDLSNCGIQQGDLVEEAYFRICIRGNDNLGGSQDLNIHKVLVSWDEMTSCWNRPQAGGTDWDGCYPDDIHAGTDVVSSITKSTETGWYEWMGSGLIDLVQFWVDNPSQNFGMLVKLGTETESPSKYFRFHSSDVDNATLRPILEISYQPQGVGKPGTEGVEPVIPETFRLEQNYPNPFNPETHISYQLPEASDVSLTIYDLVGREVRKLVDCEQSVGFYDVVWDGTNDRGGKVESGLYFYRIRVNSGGKVEEASRKMLLLK